MPKFIAAIVLHCLALGFALWAWRRHHKCECCGRVSRDVECRIQKTAYADRARNWATLCPECQEEADDHWQALWDEYNATRL